MLPWVLVFFFFGGCGLKFMGCSGWSLWVVVVVGMVASGDSFSGWCCGLCVCVCVVVGRILWWAEFYGLQWLWVWQLVVVGLILWIRSPPLIWFDLHYRIGKFFELMMRDSNLVLWVFFPFGSGEYQIVQLLFLFLSNPNDIY